MKKILLLLIIAVIQLSAKTKVLAFAGSTRTDSYNKQLVAEAAEIARKMGAVVTVIDLKDYPMPFYDADLEKNQGLPKNAKKLRDLMIQNDAVIIASPEYNSSIPAVLKNSLDWTTHNEKGDFTPEAYKGKKFALMSASPGKGGGSRALVNLRAVIEAAGGTVIPKQVSIPEAHEYFSKKDRPENPQLKNEIEQLLQLKAAS